MMTYKKPGSDKDGPIAEDPRGLIKDAYAIAGLDKKDARSIFLDWLLADAPQDNAQAIEALYHQYAPSNPEHPMSQLLKEASEGPQSGGAPQRPTDLRPRRRGRRRR